MIRLMREEDVGHCVDLGSKFHEHSYWNWLPYDKEKTYNWTMRGIENPNKLLLVAEDAPSKKIFGFFIGKVTDFWFCDEIVAEEEVMFLSPENRGGTTALRFMRAWEWWAKDRGASVMFFNPTSHGQGDKWDKFMKRLGFHKASACYRKSI